MTAIQKKRLKEIQNYVLDISKFNELSKSHGSLKKKFYIKYANKKARVFSRELWLILTENRLPIISSQSTNPSLNLNWKKGLFIEDYVNGYKRGEVFFNYTYKNIDDIDIEIWIKNLYEKCYKQSVTDDSKPFIFYIQTYPDQINCRAIEKFGYYAGILNKIENLRKRYRLEFDLWFNADSTPNRKIEGIS